MYQNFQKLLGKVIGVDDFSLPIEMENQADMAGAMNDSFLAALSGVLGSDIAVEFLISMQDDNDWGDAASYYLKGLEHIEREIDYRCGADPEFRTILKELASADLSDSGFSVEKIWQAFFPEGVGIKGNEATKRDELRKKRTVSSLELNQSPLSDPAGQILFTSNALITLPFSSDAIDGLSLSDSLKDKIKEAMNEDQKYWYDHPIPLDVDLDANEVIYGLRGLAETLQVEKERGNADPDERLSCVLSVSVTHSGLASIAREYLKEELSKSGGLKDIDVYVFTEDDTVKIIEDVIAPLIQQYDDGDSVDLVNDVFGVDGAYGRHYSFLKAIAAFWSVFVDDEIKATFKIDLDQVFPQKELIAETGGSAFDHFKTSLWGAKGTDYWGNESELGMIAGSLVNERDISKSIFTADAVYPDKPLSEDECFFYSTLPHAFSTDAELMTAYGSGQLDGINSCIQRVHVTGGTNGILVDSLRCHRPFTPTFFGRAEDQAYLLSVLLQDGVKLAYAHEYGLIMRHDKEAFAQEAIEAAQLGRAIGDYIRILYFSEYARVLSDGNVVSIKERIDPFTGCFVSYLPETITYLRFSLKANDILGENPEDGVEFLQDGARRMLAALSFTTGDESDLARKYQEETRGWNQFYDALSHAEKSKDDPLVLDVVSKAKDIVASAKI